MFCAWFHFSKKGVCVYYVVRVYREEHGNSLMCIIVIWRYVWIRNEYIVLSPLKMLFGSIEFGTKTADGKMISICKTKQ